MTKEEKRERREFYSISVRSLGTITSRHSNPRRHAVAGLFRQIFALLHFGTSAGVDLDNEYLYLVRMSQATRLSKHNGSPKASGRAEGPLLRGT